MTQDYNGLEELFDYKNKLIGDLLTNENIVNLITDDLDLREHPEDLVYRNVFPFEKIPGTTEDATTYVCCEVDIRNASANKTYFDAVIYIWAFTHESLFRLPGGRGIRFDALASEIVKTINGSREYGLGELELASVTKMSPIEHYQGRRITFNASDFNRVHQSVGKPVPSNRKK